MTPSVTFHFLGRSWVVTLEEARALKKELGEKIYNAEKEAPTQPGRRISSDTMPAVRPDTAIPTGSSHSPAAEAFEAFESASDKLKKEEP